jgi:uncharacterized protein YneF (UPF0154 family)
MRVSRTVAFWLAVIIALVLLEVAQLTHLFTIGVTGILGNGLAFVFALLLVTVLALVGAVFVGIFIGHRILQPEGFSPFEEEMMRMRQDVRDLSTKVAELHRHHLRGESGQAGSTATPTEPAPAPSGDRPSTPPGGTS